jgi:prepilin-type N-terminal cleavage/methylation domain-containing protein
VDFKKSEGGFTMIEMLIAIALLGVVVSAFMSVLFAVARGSETSRDVVRVSEEARLGFNRMVRDTREGTRIVAATATSYHVQVDFNADGVITPAPSPNPIGDFEDLVFSWDESTETVKINGETLMRKVDCLRDEGTGNCTPDVFTYSSDRLEYDWNGDGRVTWQELDKAPTQGVVGVGNNNGTLDGAEFPFISNITFAFDLQNGGAQSEFYTEAQLRNLR